MNKQSEKVTFSLGYQAIFWIGIASFWVKWKVIQVTMENNPSNIGVVRWMAFSDHWHWVSRPSPFKVVYCFSNVLI